MARTSPLHLLPLAFALAACVWLVPMLLAAFGNGSAEYRAYVDDILLRQTAKRYGASWDHGQPPWYFLEVMALMWLPTALALPWALPAWWRRLRRRDPRYLLPLAWWALVIVFFSIPAGKRDMYILPALPMVALALAPLLPGLVRRVAVRRAALGFVVALSALLLAGGLAMWFGEPGFERRLVDERGLDGDIPALAATLAAIGAFGLAAALWAGQRRAFAALVAGLVALWVGFGLMLAPLLNDSSSARGLMREVDRRIGADGELALAHTPTWIGAVSDGTLSAAAQREIGFPWSTEMVERSRRSVGATVAAARAALGVAFERLGLDEVLSFTVPANLPSQAVMRAIGMQRDESGDFRHPRVPDGHPLQPHVLYRIRRAQWEARR